jgi:hypothetical protein
MNWNLLISGKLNKEEVLKLVKDDYWQSIRVGLKGTPLDYKYEKLINYLQECNFSYEAKVRVTNYVNALKRGGLVK